MESMMPAKVIALGVLIMVMTAFAMACGGDTLEFTELTPTQTSPPTVEPTTVPVPGPTTAPVINPTTEQPTEVIPPTLEPPTQVIPATSVPATEVIPPTRELPTTIVLPGDRPIELRLMILKRDADDNVTLLKKDGALTGKDHYGIFFEPTADAWVYVLQRGSTQSIDVLFPNPAFSEQTNPVPAGTGVWVPKDVNTWFKLDENIGPESFFVVAAREQDKDLEAIIARPERVAVLGGLESLLKQKERGVGGSEKLDEEPRILSDGSTIQLEQHLLHADGDDFVYALPFEHK